jgi:uncharacterized hydrophobic protein (TIGR00271 family)
MSPRLPRIAALQNRLASLLGCTPTQREEVVRDMLRRDPREATGYWLQLVVSVGIATLGLVLGSTAVVIGAMLIAPMMGPIVAMGMGLATGSPFLVLRSSGRVVLSVVVAIAGSATIVLLLPFHEQNAEIAARTTPTVLDLITAGFCALAGVYAVMRRGSDTASTAAGTAIGISLVPPLGVSGYGVGTLNASIAGGAGLLFVTNFVAIVLAGTLAFVMAGFNQVDVRALEEKGLEDGADSPIARGLSRRLAQLFASRQGPWLRFLMPVILLAIVYVPLRRALDEMAWQVRVRGQVETAVGRLPQRVLESRVRVERRVVETFLVVLGDTQDAERARAKLDAEIRSAAAVVPRVDVLAVPDARAFAGLASELSTKAAPAPPPPPPPAEVVQKSRDLVMAAVKRRWPTHAAGDPLEVTLGVGAGELALHVTHLGSAIDAAGRELLERALSDDLGVTVSIRVTSLPPEEIGAAGDGDGFVLRLSELLALTRELEGVSVCLVQPPEDPRRRKRARAEASLQATIPALLAGHPRVSSIAGPTRSVRLVRGACPAALTATVAPLATETHAAD